MVQLDFGKGLANVHAESRNGMKTGYAFIVYAAAICGFTSVGAGVLPAQGIFQNLGFENTTLNVIVSNPWIPSFITNATIPGWEWSPRSNFGFGDPQTTVSLNNFALDAPAVTLHSSNSTSYPSLHGGYGVLLQGGTRSGGLVSGNTNGAYIYKSGQIPTTVQTLTYFASGAISVTLNGQFLPSIVLSHAASYSVWGVSISDYAGQLVELRFTTPWLANGRLDNVRFSSGAIPEPSSCVLFGFGGLIVLIMRKAKRYGTRALEFSSPASGCYCPLIVSQSCRS